MLVISAREGSAAPAWGNRSCILCCALAATERRDKERNMDDSVPEPGAGRYTEITIRLPDALLRPVGPAMKWSGECSKH
jgi:hypothetical protein